MCYIHHLPGDIMLTSMKSHCAYDTVALVQRETPEFIHRDVASQFAKFESGGLQCLGYASRWVYHSWIYKGVERRSAEEVEAAGPLHHGAVI